MAIVDELLLFEDGAALTTSRNGTNTIDFGTGAAGAAGSGTRDLGTSDEPLTLSIRWPVLPTAGGAATVQFSFMTSSDNSVFIMLQSSGVVPISAFTPAAPWGPWKKVPIPSGIRRYVRLDWTVATGPLTAGTILAGLSTEVEWGTGVYPKSYVA